MARWLVKTEPETYSFAQLQKEGRTAWDHVRNFTARNHLKAMTVGDEAMVYHSVGPKAIVGVCQVVREHYPDPTAVDEGEPADRWVAVDVVPLHSLKNEVTLAQLKASPILREMDLVKQSRLSVSPVSDAQWAAVLQLAEAPAPAPTKKQATKKQPAQKKKAQKMTKKPAKKATKKKPAQKKAAKKGAA